MTNAALEKMTKRHAEIIKVANLPPWQIQNITGERREYIYQVLKRYGLATVADPEMSRQAQINGLKKGVAAAAGEKGAPPLRLTLTRDEMLKARAMRAEGRSIEEIGRVFHMSPERVRRTINHNH